MPRTPAVLLPRPLLWSAFYRCQVTQAILPEVKDRFQLPKHSIVPLVPWEALGMVACTPLSEPSCGPQFLEQPLPFMPLPGLPPPRSPFQVFLPLASTAGIPSPSSPSRFRESSSHKEPLATTRKSSLPAQTWQPPNQVAWGVVFSWGQGFSSGVRSSGGRWCDGSVTQEAKTGVTMWMYLMPLKGTLTVVKVVNVLVCLFTTIFS